MTGLARGGRQSRRRRRQSIVVSLAGAAVLALGAGGSVQAAPPASGQYKLHVPNAGDNGEAGSPTSVPSGDDSGSGHLPIVIGAVGLVAGIVGGAFYSRRAREPGASP